MYNLLALIYFLFFLRLLSFPPSLFYHHLFNLILFNLVISISFPSHPAVHIETHLYLILILLLHLTTHALYRTFNHFTNIPSNYNSKHAHTHTHTLGSPVMSIEAAGINGWWKYAHAPFGMETFGWVSEWNIEWVR